MSVRADVDRGLAIVDQIKALQGELKEIEARLERAGLEGDQVELEDPEREGRQFLAHGSEAIVPVVFTADLLVNTFSDRGAVYDRISTALPKDKPLRLFFKPKSTWETLFDSGKKFRARAAEVLGPMHAPPFITACLQRDRDGMPKSKTRIEWNRAQDAPVDATARAAA